MEQNKQYDVFISYRRDGGEGVARSLYDRLTHAGYSVAYDRESLSSGRFDGQLMRMISNCTDVIVILDANAFKKPLPQKSTFRQEICFALKTERNVIPLMMDGFEFPKDADRLPNDIRPLRFQNGVRANMEYFDSVVVRIQKYLKSAVMTSPIKQMPRRRFLSALFVILVFLVCAVSWYAFSSWMERENEVALKNFLSCVSKQGELVNGILSGQRKFYEALQITEQSKNELDAYMAYVDFTNMLCQINFDNLTNDGCPSIAALRIPVDMADYKSISGSLLGEREAALITAQSLMSHIKKFGFTRLDDLHRRLLIYREMYQSNARFYSFGIMSLLRNIPDDKLEEFKNKTVILWDELNELHKPWIKNEADLERLGESAFNKFERRLDELKQVKVCLDAELKMNTDIRKEQQQ